MSKVKTYVHVRRHIRQLTKTIKRLHNEAKAYNAEAEYYGALAENIIKPFQEIK